VLDVQAHDRAGHGPGEQVQGVGRVPREDRHIVAARADERGDVPPGCLVGGRAGLGRVPRSPVHAGVQRQHLTHQARDLAEGGRAGCIVQIDVTHSPPGHNRHRLACAGELGEREPARGS
jgi:hypothetical protein